MSLSHVRQGFGSVRPYVHGPHSLWALLKEAFGAIERERQQMGTNAVHIEAQIGDSMIVLELADPPHASATRASIYVYVPDVDSAYEIALRHGAESVAAPADKPYQERSAGVTDGLGNTWWISTFHAS